MKSTTTFQQPIEKTPTKIHLFPKKTPPVKVMEEWQEVDEFLSSSFQKEATFIRDFLAYLTMSTMFILLGLLIGVLGYHWTAHLSWIDATVEASMILSGMGPVSPLQTNSAKLFASIYALFSGLVFVLAMGVVLSPLVYSLLKQLRLNTKD
ncbi:two pore domain potassium channel family protein [Crocosphaera sp. XPORK-15E]|uniref:two pore domain potassium channel family protein n=1 Tax=Crocosphaera sp. XPORK-15E TaxID=3110247 RepID=UPI002B20EC98|nr:two pore domain potassium channel family protein [Crocosphaera sp. XPORK-15E]MEA5532672.1 two pore domain potassium channel family protein [Crocosphaera sp. XPORK-15E]